MTYKEILKRKLVHDASGIRNPHDYDWQPAEITKVYCPVDVTGAPKQHYINVCGLIGRLYQIRDGVDKWSFEFGGFYHWHKPLAEVIPLAQEQMIRVATLKINLEFKAFKKQIKNGK